MALANKLSKGNRSREFSNLVSKEFEMNMMGELTLRPPNQVVSNGIFINQTKYVNELLKKCKMGDN